MKHFSKSVLAGAVAAAAMAFVPSSTQAAQVFATDVVIQGSLCVGFDCVNGENFGSDTLRLKENNLRIHFNDTSNSGSFPTADWRIVANDQSNGGANYLAFQDSDAGTYPFRVLQGAGNNALYVDAQGDVGLNTSNPVVELHISDGDSPTVRLEQNGSSGWQAQTWDVAGNETNFFIRDVTNASNLPLRIRANAADDAIYIDNDYQIGMFTAAPDATLHVRRTSEMSAHFQATGSGNAATLHVESADGSSSLNVDTAGNAPAELNVSNTNTTAGATARVNIQSVAGGARLHVNNSGTTANGYREMARLTNYGDPGLVFENTKNNNTWLLRAGNRFIFQLNDTASTKLFDLDGATGDLVISGTLTTTGGTCGSGCDLVFADDYDLPTIAEHADNMWSLGYLPNVGPTVENAPINISDTMGRMLNELETAHIYIAQLHERIEALEARDRVEQN